MHTPDSNPTPIQVLVDAHPGWFDYIDYTDYTDYIGKHRAPYIGKHRHISLDTLVGTYLYPPIFTDDTNPENIVTP